ncbi:MAG TPA: transposase [Allosphingosinicella sp.]|nr:transposase [Allosphingosinicella sp.]
MPRVIACGDPAPLELGDVVAALNASGFDPADEDSFAAMAPLLKGLAGNRRFLVDIAIAELKERCVRQSRENRYSSQVIMLHRASEKFFIRANFWPSDRDSIVKTSGVSPFFYHVPHDHNFSFLTVGYLGPGYWSEYYEYDYDGVVGYPGEKVDLRFVERSRLEPGKVMLYRAHRDVHNQLPADDMSVSINIMEASPRQAQLDQYRFDVKRCEIAEILSRTSSEALLALAAQTGGGNARDLVESFAESHPCERIQFSAMRALAAAEPDLDGTVELFAQGSSSAKPLIAALSARELARIERDWGWIERPGATPGA